MKAVKTDATGCRMNSSTIFFHMILLHSLTSKYRSKLGENTAKLDWLPVQHHITTHASADVLILLDCCYAGSAVRGPVTGRKELLAACEKGTMAIGQSTAHTLTFSRTLINHLEVQQRVGNAFTISELHVDLARTKLQPSPFYAILSNASRSPITLFPSGRSGNMLQERRTESVLIHLHLSGEPSLEAWKEWLATSIPEDIAKIEVGAVYKSYSTILVMSLPLDLWPFFPHNAAYSFIGIVRSNNLYLGAPITTPLHLGAPISTPDTEISESRRILRSHDEIDQSGSRSTRKRPHGDISTEKTSVPWARMGMSSGRAATAWTPEEDSLLIAERVRGLGWQAIQQLFVHKTANACRKRHEQLVGKGMDDWDSERFEHLAREYMVVRKEMWTILASRVGMSWQTVEGKVILSYQTLDTVLDD